MPKTNMLGDKDLSLDEQIERAMHDVECALNHLNELQKKQFEILASNTDAAIEKVHTRTKEMRKAGYL